MVAGYWGRKKGCRMVEGKFGKICFWVDALICRVGVVLIYQWKSIF